MMSNRQYCTVFQVAVNGQRTRIAMDISSAKEFHERLTEFCEFYSSLGTVLMLCGHSQSSFCYLFCVSVHRLCQVCCI